MTDTIPAFPNLLNHVCVPVLNEGNVHSSVVVSMRRKCKPEGHTQNNCSYEFYLSELRVKKAISNIYLPKFTMEADNLQARGGLSFVWSYLQIPLMSCHPGPPLCRCVQTKGDVLGLYLLRGCHGLCMCSQVLQVQCVYTIIHTVA